MRLHPDDGDPRHGTSNGYHNGGCRCAPCAAAGKADRLKRGVQYPHASMARYMLGGCRCDDCKLAIRVGRQAQTMGCHVPTTIAIDFANTVVLERAPAEHGTLSKYVHGCKCDACRQASAAYKAEWRARRKANA